MKYLYPLSIALLILTSCSNKKEKKPVDHAKSDWAYFQLNGNVKSVEERSYQFTDGKKGIRQREIISEHDTDLFFNEEGQLVTEKRWTADGKLFEQNKYKGREHKLELAQYINGAPVIVAKYVWDKAGKENTSILRHSPDNQQIDRIAMTYKGGKLIEKRTFNMQDNPSDKIEYIYDAKGNLIEELLYMGSEFVQFRNKYEYNDQKQKISEVRYDKDGKLLFKTTYAYEGDKVAATETYNDKNQLDYVEKYVYDEKGNVKQHYQFERFDKAETTEDYTYDSAGNRTSWISSRNGKVLMKVTYSYDQHKNLTSVTAQSGMVNSSEPRAYKYAYDNKGNWTRKRVLINQKPSFITERKISYYAE